MYDDVEPKKVDYHDRVEVIDLSTCSIDLLPENLPSKRLVVAVSVEKGN